MKNAAIFMISWFEMRTINRKIPTPMDHVRICIGRK